MQSAVRLSMTSQIVGFLQTPVKIFYMDRTYTKITKYISSSVADPDPEPDPDP